MTQTCERCCSEARTGESRFRSIISRNIVAEKQALEEANRFCAQRGKQFMAIGTYDRGKTLSDSMISDDQAISIKEAKEPTSIAQRLRVSLIVAKLAINSLKHAFRGTTTGGLIVVTFDAGETEWTLSVSDNGGGKQKRAIIAEGGLGTGIVAALARQLNALVVTKSDREGTSVSIIHHAVKPSEL